MALLLECLVKAIPANVTTVEETGTTYILSFAVAAKLPVYTDHSVKCCKQLMMQFTHKTDSLWEAYNNNNNNNKNIILI